MIKRAQILHRAAGFVAEVSSKIEQVLLPVAGFRLPP